MRIFNDFAEEDLAVGVRDGVEADENKRNKWKFLGLIPGIGGIVAFILTENMRNQMTLVDKWTILMVVILAVAVVLAIVTRNKKKDDEDQDPEGTPEAA